MARDRIPLAGVHKFASSVVYASFLIDPSFRYHRDAAPTDYRFAFYNVLRLCGPQQPAIEFSSCRLAAKSLPRERLIYDQGAIRVNLFHG